MFRKHSVTMLCGAVLLAGCDAGDVSGPVGPELPIGFTQPITFDELGARATSPMRIEVDLRTASEPLIARELEVEEVTELSDEEKIESRVSEIRRGGETATVVLELGGLEISVGSGTSFRDEGGGEALSMAAFLDLLQAELEAGRMPAVEAKRTPPLTPQSPDDAAFFATRLRLNDESDRPEIEINVDSDNFDLAQAAAGRGTLRVLGLSIDLDVAGGRTRLEQDREDVRDKVDFEGLVLEATGAGEGSVTLAGGLIVRIVDGTQIEQDSGDDRHLRSFQAVLDAVAAGHRVEAEGEGVPESPGVVVAVEVEFEIEEDAEDVPGSMEFEGSVASVDLTASTFALADASVLTVDGVTVFDPSGDLRSLAEIRGAVEAGSPVRAEGRWVPGTHGEKLVVQVRVEVDD